jgi:hypothetical protein
MTFTLKPHEYERRRGGSVVAKARPYIRLKSGEDSPPIFIQNGVYYYEDGTQIDKKDLPEWVEKEVSKISEKAKKECGLLK